MHTALSSRTQNYNTRGASEVSAALENRPNGVRNLMDSLETSLENVLKKVEEPEVKIINISSKLKK